MAWCSFFYQSGMAGQDSFRLPNGDDLPLPDPRLWNNQSADVAVDYANVPPPYRFRIHYRAVVTVVGRAAGLRTRHVHELTDELLSFGRDQGISRVVTRNAGLFFRSGIAQRVVGPLATVTESSTLGSDNFLRLIDGDRAFTYIFIR